MGSEQLSNDPNIAAWYPANGTATPAGEQVSGIYETDYRNFNRDTYVRGRETFDRTWAEVKQVILGAWWRDQKLQEKG